MGRNIGYTLSLKRSYHNMIDSILEKLRKIYVTKFTGTDKDRHLEDFILGYEIALRTLANANGSFSDRLQSVLFSKDR